MRYAVVADRGAIPQPWALYKNFPPALNSRDWSMVTMASRIFQPLLFMLAASTENQLIRQVEYLKAENQMLRKRVGKQRIFPLGRREGPVAEAGPSRGRGFAATDLDCFLRDLQGLGQESGGRDSRKAQGRWSTEDRRYHS